MLILFFLFFQTTAQAKDYSLSDEKYDLTQERIPLASIFTAIPKTSYDGLKMSFSKESAPYWTLIFGSTVLLYEYDEEILATVQHSGRKMGIGNQDRTRP